MNTLNMYFFENGSEFDLPQSAKQCGGWIYKHRYACYADETCLQDFLENLKRTTRKSRRRNISYHFLYAMRYCISFLSTFSRSPLMYPSEMENKTVKGQRINMNKAPSQSTSADDQYGSHGPFYLYILIS